MARWSDFIDDFQLVNEFKGFPALVGIDVDLDAANQWWDKVGTPSTAVTMIDVAGDSLTETYEFALKTVTDAADEGLSQTWTYADEPRVKSGRTLSAICAIWSVGGLGVSAKLVNSDASETAGDVSASMAAWTIIKIEGHVLAGTSCTFQVTANGAGTFYVVPLGACVGPTAMPLGPRGLVRRDVDGILVVNGSDPGGAETDVDATASTSPLTVALGLVGSYGNATTPTRVLFVRQKGATNWLAWLQPDKAYRGTIELGCDDAQVIQYDTNAAAGDTEQVYLTIEYYLEWE